jgi:hypothetical protein
MRKILCLSVVALAAAILASTAAADTGMTLGFVGTPNLSSRVSINVPVTVSCPPFDPSLTLVADSVSVSVEQASGRAIAHGSGDAFGGVSAPLFPCDGAEHNVTVNVLADTAGPPFHGGPAVFSAFANAAAGIPCFPGSTTCFIITAFQGASVGPTSLNIH